MKSTDPPVIVNQHFQVDEKVLWKAITDVNEMRLWFFKEIPQFNPEPGFSTEFVIENEGRQFTHLWKIIEVDPVKRIVYDWSYREYPGRGKVIFQIDKLEKGCSLTLINEVTEDFSDDIPEFQRSSCQGGWEYFIQQQLPAYLTKSRL